MIIVSEKYALYMVLWLIIFGLQLTYSSIFFAGFGCDTAAVINILAHRDATQRALIQQEYRTMYSGELNKRLSSELSGNIKVYGKLFGCFFPLFLQIHIPYVWYFSSLFFELWISNRWIPLSLSSENVQVVFHYQFSALILGPHFRFFVLFFDVFGLCQRAVLLWMHDPVTRDATIVRQALSGDIIDLKAATEVICSRTPSQILQFKQVYFAMFGVYLEHDIEYQASGDHKKVILSLSGYVVIKLLNSTVSSLIV